MANRSAENTSQGYVLCCGCRYFREWLRPRFAPARSAIWFFRCAVVSSRYIVCLLKNIQIRSMNFAKSCFNLYFILCHSKTISCNMKRLYRKKNYVWKFYRLDLDGTNVVVLRLARIFLNLELHWFVNCICLTGSRWWSLCAELDTTELKS